MACELEVKRCIYCPPDQAVYLPPAMFSPICPSCKASREAKLVNYEKIAQPFAAIDALLKIQAEECERTQKHWEHAAELIRRIEKFLAELREDHVELFDNCELRALEKLKEHLAKVKELDTDDDNRDNGTETGNDRGSTCIHEPLGSASDLGEASVHDEGRQVSEC